MNVGWHEQRSEGGGCGMHICSPVFDRNRQCAAFSVTRSARDHAQPALKKNGLRVLRSHPDGSLVSAHASNLRKSVIGNESPDSRLFASRMRFPVGTTRRNGAPALA